MQSSARVLKYNHKDGKTSWEKGLPPSPDIKGDELIDNTCISLEENQKHLARAISCASPHVLERNLSTSQVIYDKTSNNV